MGWLEPIIRSTGAWLFSSKRGIKGVKIVLKKEW
jgi:hypothetical protein